MRSLILTFAFIACCSLVGAAEKASPDEQAIRSTIDTYVKAFNAADAQAVADHWADDAEYVLPDGRRVVGRDSIRGAFEKLFSDGQQRQIDVVDARVRLLSRDTALEEGTVRVAHGADDVEESTYLAIHIRQGRQWKLSAVRETTEPVAKEEPPAKLAGLSWLVGTWQEGSGDNAATSRFSWMKNESFLSCQFRVPTPDRDTLEGTQVIGWDPESHVIRSWMFDADGGFGEGLWTPTSDGWSVKFVQLLPDGRRASSTNIYTRIDDDTFEWRSTERKVDGRDVPDVGPLRSTRRN